MVIEQGPIAKESSQEKVTVFQRRTASNNREP